MSKLKKVRWNPKTFQLMNGRTGPYWAGYYVCRRDNNMDMARRFRKDGTREMVKLFVDFARDDHRKYLGHLKAIRKAHLAHERMGAYQDAVLARVLGVMQ